MHVNKTRETYVGFSSYAKITNVKVTVKLCNDILKWMLFISKKSVSSIKVWQNLIF